MSYTSGEVIRATGGNTTESIISTIQRITTTKTFTSDTTLATPVGFSAVSFEAGKSYQIKGHIYTTSTSNGGLKATLTADGLTFTSIVSLVQGATAGGNLEFFGVAESASLIGQSEAFISLQFDGTFVVNAAGSLVLQFAQNNSHADTTSILAGSWVEFKEI